MRLRLKHAAAAAVLAFGATGAAHAEHYDLGPVVYILPANTATGHVDNLTIGSFTLTDKSNIEGLVYAADTLSGTYPWGGTFSFTLASVSPTGSIVSGVGTYTSSGATFSYDNLAAGSYTVRVSFNWANSGQLRQAQLFSTIDTTTAVPEPAPVALAGLGVASLLIRRRKARKA
ncbi:PEP-CTERM sorting domain-containing protein [Derxia gummosa]|uniref:PEP-CTERM sorting domain-containing protein n=1 Tax=Derxia gummosa DSM 723 TaxID=1121388 RepID=A0A8B6X3W2_9BURK|nr:PEP-CTERM sorting domain-containing protein [Derxia gummosa]